MMTAIEAKAVERLRETIRSQDAIIEGWKERYKSLSGKGEKYLRKFREIRGFVEKTVFYFRMEIDNPDQFEEEHMSQKVKDSLFMIKEICDHVSEIK